MPFFRLVPHGPPAALALRDAIYSGPRGVRKKLTGPFQIWLNAPDLGLLAQALGAYCRYKTSLSPRLSVIDDPAA